MIIQQCGLLLLCERCSHSWVSRKGDLPKRCPKCNSPYWNKEKTIKKDIVSKMNDNRNS